MEKELDLFPESEFREDAPCMFNLDAVCPYYWTSIPLPCKGCRIPHEELEEWKRRKFA